MSSSPYATPHIKKRMVVSAFGAIDSLFVNLSILGGLFMFTKSKKVILCGDDVLVRVAVLASAS